MSVGEVNARTSEFLNIHLKFFSYIAFNMVSLFQTPLPNYKDVDLSFSYELVNAGFDFTNMEKNSAYDNVQLMSAMSKLSEIHLSSPQIQDFIRLV
jgi:hypothetical protein